MTTRTVRHMTTAVLLTAVFTAEDAGTCTTHLDAEITARFGKNASERIGEYSAHWDMTPADLIEWAREETSHLIRVARGDDSSICGARAA